MIENAKTPEKVTAFNKLKLKKHKSVKPLDEINQLYNTSIQERTMIIGSYSEIAKYTMPYTDMWDVQTKTIIKKANKINATVLSSWKDMNSFIMSTMFSTGGWAEVELDKTMYEQLRASSEQIESILGRDYNEVQTKLATDSKNTFKHMVNSNYMSSVAKALVEAQNLGTGAIKIIDTKRPTSPLRYKHIPVARLSFCEDELGNPSHTFVTHKNMPVGHIVKLFGKKPQGDKKNYDLIEANVLDDMGEVWHKVVYVMGTQDVVYSDKLSYNDTVVFRWDLSQHSVYGTGIGFELIDEFKDLARYKELQKTSAEINVFPPLLFTGSIELMSKLNYGMGEVNFGGENPELGAVNPMNVGGNYIPLGEEIKTAESKIREAYISQPIGDYTDRSTTTATEIQQRMTIFRQRMSGVYESLSNELLKATFLNTFKLLSEKGMFSFDTDLYDLIKLKYTNQMSKSADMDTAQRVISYKNMAIESFSKAEQYVLSSVDMLVGLGDLMDIPKSYYADKKKAKENVTKLQENELQQPQPQIPLTPEGGTI